MAAANREIEATTKFVGGQRPRRRSAVAFGALLSATLASAVFAASLAGGVGTSRVGLQVATGAEVAALGEIQKPTTPATTARALPTPDASISINWVGDTVLGSQYGLPPDNARSVFSDVDGTLAKADLTIGNLEGTFGTSDASKCGAGSNGNTCFAFQAPPANAAALADAGFDVMNLANNHALDYGADGQRQTITALDRNHIRHAGLPGSVTTVRLGGRRVAIIGFAPYRWATSLIDIPAARALVTRAAHRADLVIVLMHVGAEGSDKTHTPNGAETAFGEDRGSSRAFAHAVIDGGADLVLGSGPHVLRGIERYHDRLIAHSLGNFAGHTNFGMGGVLSLSGVLHVTLGPTGRAISGKLTAVRLVGPGTPERDPSQAAVQLVDKLSRDDFGHGRFRMDGRGRFGLARRDATHR